MNWDQYFTDMLGPVAAKSKDKSRKIGCIIVGPENEIRTTGYNNMPRGCDDTVELRHTRPEKYLWFEHAERNAIYNAARHGASLKGCKAYVNLPPCMDCARGLVQVGITTVITPPVPANDPKFAADFDRIGQLFHECGVTWVEKEPTSAVGLRWPEDIPSPLVLKMVTDVVLPRLSDIKDAQDWDHLEVSVPNPTGGRTTVSVFSVVGDNYVHCVIEKDLRDAS